ncbi:hypothetical protein QUA54_30185 [Microcoleus sp. MOSTC5]
MMPCYRLFLYVMRDTLDLPKSHSCGLRFEIEELLDTYHSFGLEFA